MIYGVVLKFRFNRKIERVQFIECRSRDEAMRMVEPLQFLPDIDADVGCKIFPARGSSVILSMYQLREIATAYTGDGRSTGKPSFCADVDDPDDYADAAE